MRVVGFAPGRSRAPLVIAAVAAAGALAWRVREPAPPAPTRPPPAPVHRVTAIPALPPVPPNVITLRAQYFMTPALHRYCGGSDALVYAHFHPKPGHGELVVLVPCSAVDGAPIDGPAPRPLVLQQARVYELTLVPTDDGQLRATEIVEPDPF